MEEKTLHTLEYPKILERLAGYAAFHVSADLARGLRPATKMEDVLHLQATTREACRLLSVHSDIGVGGARDVRTQIELAAHAGVLTPNDLLDIKFTMVAARNLSRSFATLKSSVSERAAEYPNLSEIANRLSAPAGLVDAITRALSENGEILDSASERLANIRRELKVAHERLLTRLNRIINDARMAAILQEPIITQRNGRYVIPLRAEFKGRLRSIVHDQSGSGATLFVEPLVVVDLNNEWHELQLSERDEERRILAELSTMVGQNAEMLLGVVQGLAEFDLALMCGRYAEDLHASEPDLQPFRPVTENHPGSIIRLYQARHPLLDPTKVVPVDVDLDERTFSLVITGPNTGGKTVTLKTVGLLVLMAQSGLHIPAQSGSILTVFEDVYADIGDEQSIEQSLSTFSGHIRNVIHILKKAHETSLVLLDELGAGTDPQEGAALARSILAFLLQQRVTSLIATHYPELKAYAHSATGVVNASMEFDVRSLRPTYHLIIGLPGRSNALLIAERLGLSKDIIQEARKSLNPADLRVENLLDEIHRQRDIARRQRAAAEEAHRNAEKLRAELAQRLEHLDDERRAVLEEAHTQAEKELSALKDETQELRRALSRARQPLDGVSAIQEQVEDSQMTIKHHLKKARVQNDVTVPATYKVGGKVRLRSLQMQGVITAMDEDEVEVQLGALRVRAQLDDLQPFNLEETPPPPPAAPAQRAPGKKKAATELAAPFHPSPGMELDLRGQRAEDALDQLDHYLESAYLAGLPFVRIIHGKGSGRLRQVVRQVLRQSANVSSWVVGQDNEGGDGVTVAHLKTD